MIASEAAALTARWVQIYGETEIVITRTVGASSPANAVGQQFSTQPIMAVVRNYSPEEIQGNIHQGDSQVILEGAALASLVSQLVAAGIPAGIDDELIRRSDKILIRGRQRNVESGSQVAIGQQLVRINVQVRG